MTEPTRSLRAIMFTDIVGYTAMMQRDEKLALSQAQLHENVIYKHVAAYRGRIENFYGDGSLCTFDSAQEAVKCAQSIQIFLQQSSFVPLRIGLHIGDILRDGSKLYGDGINIASRIEGAGHAGTILMSEDILDKIKNDRSLKTQKLGSFTFKNVSQPITVYALVDDKLTPINDSLLTGRIAQKSSGSLKRVYGVPVLIVIASLFIGILGGYLIYGNSDRSGSAKMVIRTVIQLGEDHEIYYNPSNSAPLSISNDGAKVVYVGTSDVGKPILYLRNLSSYETRGIPGTDGARHPFFSPDGESVGFFTDNSIKRIQVSGSIPVTLAEVMGTPHGADWAPDGQIYFSLGGNEIWSIPENGGPTRRIPVRLDSTEVCHLPFDTLSALPLPLRFPSFVEKGKLLLTAGYETENPLVGILDLNTGQFHPVIKGSQGVYLEGGYLIYGSPGGIINAVRWDKTTRCVTNESKPILGDVFRGPGAGKINFMVSELGTLMYVKGGFERSIHLVDSYGKSAILNTNKRGYRFPRISPDESQIAITVDPRPSKIWIVDLERASSLPIANQGDGHNILPIWSPNGEELLFHSSQTEMLRISHLRDTQTYTFENWNNHGIYPFCWSADDKIVAVSTAPGEFDRDLFLVDLEKKSLSKIWDSDRNEHAPSLSPDNQWLAFISELTGVTEIFILSYPDRGQPIQITTGGGTDPHWSNDGMTLFFRRNQSMFKLDMSKIPPQKSPEEMFTAAFDFSQIQNWDVLSDGRFVMIKGDPTTTRQIQVVANWTHELSHLK